MKKTLRRLSQLVVLSVVVAGGLVGTSTAAQAATVGTPSITYSGVNNPPTADKPQSKLWWNDGSWWANMWTTGSGWSIYRLDRGTATWVDTGVRTDSRGTTSSDTLWDGTHLYIASNYVTTGSSVTAQARLYRYSYSGGTYTLDVGFPTVISGSSSETLTIAQDSTGEIWATWTQTTATTSTVYVNHSLPGGTGWGTPFVVPAADPNPTPDDLSAVIAFKGDEIGVMWTDQATGTAYWATHKDGEDPVAASSWQVKEAITGNKMVNDHLNIKSLQADPAGRVFAVVKTALDEGLHDPNAAQLVLVVFKPGTGSFEQTVITRAADCVSRPQIMLDTANNLIRALYTAPSTSVSGCAFSGVAGSIYEKTASMDNPVFEIGRGTVVIEDEASANMNDVTSTKQSVNAATGLVVMASDHVAKRYWFSDRSLGTPPPDPTEPAASFSVTPTSGTAPLTVAFTDTSTGGPTSWAWDFGDGETATAQNPSHTYTSGRDLHGDADRRQRSRLDVEHHDDHRRPHPGHPARTLHQRTGRHPGRRSGRGALELPGQRQRRIPAPHQSRLRLERAERRIRHGLEPGRRVRPDRPMERRPDELLPGKNHRRVPPGTDHRHRLGQLPGDRGPLAEG